MTDKKKTNVTIDNSTDGIRGKITLNEEVVATIAGMAARQIDGISSLGKSRLIPFGDDPRRGIEAQVGNKQAAFDIDVVISYGIDIRKVAAELRTAIADGVNKMAGREVVEVNINVVDIKLPEDEKPVKETPPPRVQ
ncbi:MAG: Asp23/Gls24 family envelope stress response protein [Deltaproteobacteria bacterium]|nr:Asp23/Gls24 family envelope stress response protein [Deltaproteobacteria bacterium]